jgi:hypothetical protein
MWPGCFKSAKINWSSFLGHHFVNKRVALASHQETALRRPPMLMLMPAPGHRSKYHQSITMDNTVFIFLRKRTVLFMKRPFNQFTLPVILVKPFCYINIYIYAFSPKKVCGRKWQFIVHILWSPLRMLHLQSSGQDRREGNGSGNWRAAIENGNG